uniref:Uncharacterized protein n=1 Tax=Panagrolaimus sp. ES5 TaxID=591445 RepID=A0AC34G693_9BILA
MGEESGEREDKVVYRERLLRGICAILFLIIFLLLLGGMIF